MSAAGHAVADRACRAQRAVLKQAGAGCVRQRDPGRRVRAAQRVGVSLQIAYRLKRI